MDTKPIDPKSSTCVQCHFLCRLRYHASGIFDRFITLTEQERRAIQAGVLPDAAKVGDMQCGMGVWRHRTEHPATNIEAAKGEVHKERGDTCFFVTLSVGMSIDAAKELERRHTAAREAEKDRAQTRLSLEHTQTSLKYAMAAIIVSAAIGLAQVTCDSISYIWPRDPGMAIKPATATAPTK